MITDPVHEPEESRMVPDTLYYDRDGNPIDLEQWDHLSEDLAYCRVAQTVIGCDNEETAVLTIWKGVDCHSSAVLSTAIVAGGRLSEVRDYDTQAEALEGHNDVVKHIVNNLRPHGLPAVFDGVNERWDEFVRPHREV